MLSENNGAESSLTEDSAEPYQMQIVLSGSKPLKLTAE